MIDKGYRETPDEEIYYPSALTPSTQAVYGMDGLRKNRKQDSFLGKFTAQSLLLFAI